MAERDSREERRLRRSGRQGGTPLRRSGRTAIIAHKRTLEWMSADHWIQAENRYEKARPKAARPTDTFLTTGSLTAGGEQIDYGYLGRWHDPRGDRIRRVWAFVIVLAWSRHMFLRPVLSMDQSSWVAAHTAAWEFFGGVPRRLVPDNLRTGVDKPDLYDPNTYHRATWIQASKEAATDRR